MIKVLVKSDTKTLHNGKDGYQRYKRWARWMDFNESIIMYCCYLKENSYLRTVI